MCHKLEIRNRLTYDKSNICIVYTGGRTKCGAVLTGHSEVIVSPDQDGDGHYETSVNCLWTIQLHDDYVIVFNILEMDIQMESPLERPKCKADYLEVKVIEKQ